MDNYRIGELIDRLDSESWYIRQREAVDPLIEIGRPAVPALLAALQAKPHRKAIISYILYQIDHSSLDRALPVLLEELRMDDEWGFGEAAWALAEMGPAALSAVPHLIDILHDDGARTGSRVGAAKVLWRIADPADAILSAFARTLSDGEADMDIRTEAAHGCVRIGQSAADAVPALVDALGDSHWWMRLYAVRFLARLGKTARAVVPNLTASLRDEDYNVRRNAAYALAQMGEAAAVAVPELIHALEEEGIAGVAAEALARIGDDALIVLKKRLKDAEGPSVRYAVYAVQCMDNGGETLSGYAGEIFSPAHSNFNFPEPQVEIDDGKKEAFERIFQSAQNAGASGVIDYSCEYPKHEFLWYLAGHRNLLCHGSNRVGMEVLEPQQAAGDSDYENNDAVYATENTIKIAARRLSSLGDWGSAAPPF